jgi:hypothetical protein
VRTRRESSHWCVLCRRPLRDPKRSEHPSCAKQKAERDRVEATHRWIVRVGTKGGRARWFLGPGRYDFTAKRGEAEPYASREKADEAALLVRGWSVREWKGRVTS